MNDFCELFLFMTQKITRKTFTATSQIFLPQKRLKNTTQINSCALRYFNHTPPTKAAQPQLNLNVMQNAVKGCRRKYQSLFRKQWKGKINGHSCFIPGKKLSKILSRSWRVWFDEHFYVKCR